MPKIFYIPKNIQKLKLAMLICSSSHQKYVKGVEISYSFIKLNVMKIRLAILQGDRHRSLSRC